MLTFWTQNQWAIQESHCMEKCKGCYCQLIWQVTLTTVKEFFKVKAKLILWPAVSQSWCQAPIWDLRPIFPILSLIISRQFRICWCGALSLTRSQVCTFQFLPGITSAAFLRSESHGTHGHILLSLFLRLPQPGGPGSCIYFPQEQGNPVIP
jgi:hypothetical protein